MTAPRLDLRRPPTRPVGNLFRVTAAVSFLTLPLLWAVYVLAPLFEPDSCPPDSRGMCPPSVDSVGRVNEPALILATACAELVVIGCYLAWAAVRRTLEPRAALRWLPVAVTIVVLAVGGFGWLIDGGDLNGLDSVGGGFVLLFALWLLTPLVLYGVARADRRAVIPVAVGLAPTAACNALVMAEAPPGALPALMLVVSAVVVMVRRRPGRSVEGFSADRG